MAIATRKTVFIRGAYTYNIVIVLRYRTSQILERRSCHQRRYTFFIILTQIFINKLFLRELSAKTVYINKNNSLMVFYEIIHMEVD